MTMLLLIIGCAQHPHYLGYVEGRLTYISSPVGGRLTALPVVRGQTVKTGDLLFQLEDQPQTTDINAAKAQVDQISAQLADKMKGQRPSELAAISAQIEQAKAQAEYAEKDVARKKKLVQQNVIEQNQLDLANQNLKVAQANVKQLEANLTTGNLPGRNEQINSLKAQLDNARTNLEKAQWYLQQTKVSAPINALVYDTYYRVGEQVPGNQPVLSLLAPHDIKIVFFVDEPSLSKLKVGQQVQVTCDSCQPNIIATIRYISASAEFTPPIIYSRSARSKLVYQVEAEFNKATNLNPGQPVEIYI